MKNLVKIIKSFHKARVLVIGDLILDEYIWGDVERISPEAPVPVVWARKRNFVPGGSANVANNLRSLGARTSIAGVVGAVIEVNDLDGVFEIQVAHVFQALGPIYQEDDFSGRAQAAPNSGPPGSNSGRA